MQQKQKGLGKQGKLILQIWERYFMDLKKIDDDGNRTHLLYSNRPYAYPFDHSGTPSEVERIELFQESLNYKIVI